MTEYDAKVCNDKDFSNSYRYSVGDETHKFNTEKEIIQLAKKVWRKHFPIAKVLILGEPALASEPQTILIGPIEYKRLVNKMVKLTDKMSWEQHPKQMDEIMKAWDLLNTTV